MLQVMQSTAQSCMTSGCVNSSKEVLPRSLALMSIVLRRACSHRKLCSQVPCMKDPT